MNQFSNMVIEFSPCTGFGANGVTAVLSHCGKAWGMGHGSTEDEAVLEAMIDAGVEYNKAFDNYGLVVANAYKITRR